MSNLIVSPKLSIENLLNDPVTLQVPEWQRFYSWTSTEVEEFWYDVKNYWERYKPGGADYFIGTVIVVSPAGMSKRLLLDGQQRIATSVILLGALRDAVRSLIPSDPNLIGLDVQIEERCIKTRNFSTGLDQRRLILTQQDDNFFEQNIVGNTVTPPVVARLKPSQRLLWRAKQYFEDRLRDEARTRTPDGFNKFVVGMQQRLREDVVAIAVTMDDENNAISVFETLNDRGVSLSTSELVRAYLLQKAPANRPNVITLWQTIFDLEGQPRHKNLLRHLWIAGHGDVKTRTLSKVIKDDLDAKGGLPALAVSFAQDMADKAVRYSDIVAATTSDADLNTILREVSLLGAQALYPALLSAIEKWPGTTAAQKLDIRSYARALVNGYFRHVTIGEREGTKFEKLAYSQAKNIADGTLNSGGAIQQIASLVPTDTEFEAEFAVKAISASTAQYVLRKFEDHIRGPASPMQVGPARNAHVEHVYPQNPPAAARLQDHEDWVNRIGNLTLLSGMVNRAMSNANYGTKRPEYLKSGVMITVALANAFAVWDKASIDARQLQMAAVAKAIWAI